jgi:biopolymer transport protein ExbB/TolQ
MKALLELYDRGGPVMIAIVGLSVVLYTRCFHILIRLGREQRQLNHGLETQSLSLAALRRRQLEVRDTFRQQRMVLGAMIAAAPLLGLLGTVNGMMKTFDSLSGQAGQKSMEGLAHGISEVLVATESGLAVAIPALLLVYLAHRAVHRQMQRLNELEAVARGEPRS